MSLAVHHPVTHLPAARGHTGFAVDFLVLGFGIDVSLAVHYPVAYGSGSWGSIAKTRKPSIRRYNVVKVLGLCLKSRSGLTEPYNSNIWIHGQISTDSTLLPRLANSRTP